MTMLFIGGEDTDFDLLTNGTYVETRTLYYRSTHARCAIAVPRSYAQAMASFTQSSSNFWVGMQMAIDDMSRLARDWQTFLFLNDAGTPRLKIQTRAQDRAVRLVKVGSNNAETVVATSSSAAFQSAGPLKVDFNVVYSASGRFRMYVSQALVLDYQGDITAGGSTGLNGLWLGNLSDDSAYLGVPTYFSEIIACDRDTRTLSVKTHTPVATATGHAWSGNQTDVSETIVNTTNLISTGVADAEALFTIDPPPSGNFAVRAVKVSTYAARGEAGPSQLQIGVKTSGSSFYNPGKTLDTGYGSFSETFEVNPRTNAAWSLSDLSALQIAAKSKT